MRLRDPSPGSFIPLVREEVAKMCFLSFPKVDMTDPRIYLFACVHNAGRSQMAAAWFNDTVDPTVARAVSAGTEPDSAVHPEVVVVMKEVGIDLSAAQPRKLTDDLARQATLLVTMGCGK